MRWMIITLVGLAFVVSGCDEGGSTTSKSSSGGYELNGYAQKGPLISGSSVTIQLLDNDLDSKGSVYETETSDDTGSFSVDLPNSVKYVGISTTGYFFDEVTGDLGDGTLTLRTLAHLPDGEDINVNVLTHLERNRLITLVDDGEDFPDARDQAKEEVLAVFGIDASSIDNFQNLDISGSEDGDEILLAVSATLLQAAVQEAGEDGEVTAELSSILASMVSDISADGDLDDSDLTGLLAEAAQELDLAAVRSNLQGRFDELGIASTVPDFENWLDTDGDGTLNITDGDDDADGLLDGEDPNQYVREPAWGEVAPLSSRRNGLSGAGVDGLIYVTGGRTDSSVLSNNEVYDPDTDAWETLSAMPTARWIMPNTTPVVDGKLYLIGGRPSEDGEPVPTVEVYDTVSDSWSAAAAMDEARESAAAAVVDGLIYVFGGYGESGGLSNLEVFDPGENDWSTRSMPQPIVHGTAVAIGSIIYVYGPIASTSSHAFYAYDTVEDSWELLAEKPSPTSTTVAIELDGNVVFLAGFEVTGPPEVYEVDTDSWEHLGHESLQREFHTAAVAEEQIYVLGGQDVPGSDGLTDTVMVYRPQFDFAD